MSLSLRVFEFEGGSNLVTPVLIGSRLTRQTKWSHFVNYLCVCVRVNAAAMGRDEGER